jgi:hypothetical protein
MVFYIFRQLLLKCLFMGDSEYFTTPTHRQIDGTSCHLLTSYKAYYENDIANSNYFIFFYFGT